VSIDDILRSLHEVDAGGAWAKIGDAEVYGGAVDGAVGERETCCDPAMPERADATADGVENTGAATGESEATSMATSSARLTTVNTFLDAMQSDDQKPTISVCMVPDNNQCAQPSSMLGDEEIVNPTAAAAAVDESFLAPPSAYFSHAVPHSPVLGCVNEFFDSAPFDQCLLQPPQFEKQQEFIGFDAICMNDFLEGNNSDLELQCFDNWEELFPTLLV